MHARVRLDDQLVYELADFLDVDLVLAALDDFVQEADEDFERHADVLRVEVASVDLLFRREVYQVLLEQVLVRADVSQEAPEESLGDPSLL